MQHSRVNRWQLVWLCAVLAGSLTALADSPGWKVSREEYGITSYRAERAGQHLPAFRARTHIPSSGWYALAILDDVDRACEWTAHCAEMRRVGALNEQEVLVYAHMDAPWPVHDRDVLTRVSLSYPAEGVINVGFRQTTLPSLPARHDIVRIPAMRGHYRFKMLDPQRSEVEYELFIDPGGTLPDWLKGFVSRNFAHDTVAALRERVRWAQERGLYSERAQSLEDAARRHGFVSPLDARAYSARAGSGSARAD